MPEVNELEKLVKEINKEFGNDSIMKLSDTVGQKEDVIPTGALSLDLALGVGGMPRGRIVEIFGKESSGKSTLALNIIKNAQHLGDKCAYIDLENTMDINYCKNIGIDVGNVLLSQPRSAEQALGIAEKLIASNQVKIIVIDSVAALAPQKEIDGEIGDQQMALQARLMSKFLRIQTQPVNKHKVIVIFINQIRKANFGGYGKPEDTPGGLALKFYATLRMEVKPIEKLMKGDIHIGNKVQCKIVKSKAAAPSKIGIFDIIFGRGIRKLSSIFEAAIENGVITKDGNTYSYKNKKLGVGENNAYNKFKSDKEMIAEIDATTRETFAKRQAEFFLSTGEDENIERKEVKDNEDLTEVPDKIEVKELE